MEGNLRFKINWASLIVGRKFTVFALFSLEFEGNFQVQAPGSLYLEGRFNGGFFTLRVWGAYIWRGLYMEGLIFGILRYFRTEAHATNSTVWPVPYACPQPYHRGSGSHGQLFRPYWGSASWQPLGQKPFTAEASANQQS